MGSMNNPNSWAPYWNYKDCSQGICSFYCPQWCYIIFTPPPPVEPSDHNSNFNFSPLIVAVIGILATSFLLLSYYIAILKCRRRRGDQNPSPELASNHNQINHDTRQVASSGLDESLIKSIAVCKYKRGDELVEGTECAVCLSEFQEDESLRLLPKCSHAFHLPCIDTWLKSHSNCPLCRCNVSFSNPLPSQAPISQPGPTTRDLFSLETQHQNEVTLVVDDHPETDHQEEVVGSLVSNANEYPFQAGGNTLIQNSQPRDSITDVGQECFQQLRRSISMGSFACQSHLLVADILHIYKDGEDLGSFTCDGKADDGNRVIKRSVSTGRFTVTMHEKGKSCIIPN